MTGTSIGNSAPVRILLPDHAALDGVPDRAMGFAADLRATAGPATYLPGEEPWHLPEPLTSPAVETTLAAILHPWAYAVGDHDHHERDTAIALNSATTGHMGVYIAAASTEQLQVLAAAQDLLAAARETGTGERRFARMAHLAEYLGVLADTEDTARGLRAWEILLRLFAVATAAEPSAQARPRLLDHHGRIQPAEDLAGTSPATDTATMLAAIDASPARPVDLDTQAFAAYRRLCAEWHLAIYGDRADSTDALLTSFTY